MEPTDRPDRAGAGHQRLWAVATMVGYSQINRYFICVFFVWPLVVSDNK